ncbi:LuxR C-terminal-related transcriptional regulator [Amycolatopsis sp. WGS_07]|uniref:LuxR C-terminal-related transcriptional regulator n=1 Tax=Amycolatopsis sp. WGS_07 TaxID=3076764 RepID=UPI0038733F61
MDQSPAVGSAKWRTGGDDSFLVNTSIDNEVVRFGLERMLQSIPRVHDPGNAPDGSKRADADIDRTITIRLVSELAGAAGPRPARRSLVVLDSTRPEDLATAARSGAVGFLDLAELTRETLQDALTQIDRGKTPTSDVMVRHLLNTGRPARPAQEREQPPLTPRELDVLALLADGMSNKLIARNLFISAHGVKRLVSSILAKLNCPNRTLAAARAIEEKIVKRPNLP